MATASGDPAYIQQTCAGCSKPDYSDGTSVVCHHCRRWYHGACAVGSDGIMDGSWLCAACVSTTNESAKSIVSNSSTRSARMRLELLRLEEIQKAKEKHMLERQEQERLREERIQKEKEELTEKFIDDKYALLMAEALEDGACSVKSGGSRQNSLNKVRKWMEAGNGEVSAGDTALGDSIVSLPQPPVAGKGNNLLHGTPLSSMGSKVICSNDSRQNTGAVLRGQTLYPSLPKDGTRIVHGGGIHGQRRTSDGLNLLQTIVEHNPPLPSLATSASALPVPPASASTMPRQTAPASAVPSVSVPGYPMHQNLPRQQHFQPMHGAHALPFPSGQPHHPQADQPWPQPVPVAHGVVHGPFPGQYQQQMAARQVVPRELPVFTGNPEDWPLFISSYRNSTIMCGYTDGENLMRLQKCLRGNTLDAVRSNLLLPSSVPQVMATLETLFGNPERLIQSLLGRVRNTPTPKADRLETLINFGVVVQNLVGHLKAANQQVHLTNPSLLHDLVDKLPANIRLDWALYKKRVIAADLETFSNYMSAIISAASDVTRFSEPEERPARNEKQKQKEKAFVNAHSSGDNRKQVESRKADESSNNISGTGKSCFVCKKMGHRVKECFKFKSLSLNDRWTAVKTHQLCQKCLVPHGRWPCRTSKSCDISGCSANHHSLLHPGVPEVSSEVAVVSVHRQPKSLTIFRIIPVVLYGKGTRFETFAFLDEGSDLTLMDKEIADQLGVEGEHKSLCLKWTSNVTRDETDSRQINLEISGIGSEKRLPLVNVRTVGRLDLPLQTLDYEQLARRFPHLRKLPIRSYENAAPRLLIGLSNLQLAVPLKCREGCGSQPMATKTRLGWTVFGNMAESNVAHSFHICECTSDESLHDLVKEFFATENLGIIRGPLPEGIDDTRAKAILRETTWKGTDGHYETGLLWRYDQFEFPPSYAMAARRFHCLERRLRAHPELRDNLDKQIMEYQTKGYAHKATKQELEVADPKRVWYLPLGIVTNPKKPGKVRIIWDAAAKVNGISFNSMLLKGPDMLTSLPSVLFRFRERKFCVTADIREMYHQVKICPVDRSSQRFLYRSDPLEELEIYIMDVCTFGSTCSPCSAQHVKNVNAAEWKEVYPEAATAIVQNHYVDDYLDSRDTEDDLAKLATDVRTVHFTPKELVL